MSATRPPPEPTLDRAQRDELLRIAGRRARGDGTTATAIAFLSFLRSARPTAMRHGIIEPSLCVVLQGEKRLLVGRDAQVYGAGWYVMSAIEFPTSGQIIGASTAAPYLALRIALDVREIAEVIVEADVAIAHTPVPRGPAVFVGPADGRLIGCLLRLVQLLDDPDAAAYLAGPIKREIIYRLLRTERGPLIYRSVKPTSLGVGRAIDWLRRHFDQPIDITALARASRMSVSGLRHEFKAATALAPLQFQKQLRLQEARRLLISGEADAGTAAFRVGYESPSQFSREYRRMFGAPPIRDVRKLAGTPADL
jgi:AraC-like DNA-binding protein